MARLCFAISPTIRAEPEFNEAMSGHSMRLVHTKAVKKIMLKVFSIIFLGLGVKQNIRAAKFATHALHV